MRACSIRTASRACTAVLAASAIACPTTSSTRDTAIEVSDPVDCPKSTAESSQKYRTDIDIFSSRDKPKPNGLVAYPKAPVGILCSYKCLKVLLTVPKAPFALQTNTEPISTYFHPEINPSQMV